MTLAKITKVEGTAVYLSNNDIDTDQIIPARFMKCITFDGLGQFAFYDAKMLDKQDGKIHPLDNEKFQGYSILLTGENFGCGSSREHAPQAMYHSGFRAIIALSFAEIFFNNAITLGIVCVTVSKNDLLQLAKLITDDSKSLLSIDIVQKKIQCKLASFDLMIPDEAREPLIEGRWDPIADLLEGITEVKKCVTNVAYFF